MNRILATATLALGLVFSVTPAASAQSVRDESIDRIKAEAHAAISQRLGTLDELEAAIDSSVHLSAAHAAQLLEDTRSTRDGLTSLDSTIEEADTLDTVLELAAAIATEHRVYLVLVPRVFEVIGSDAVSAIAVQMSAVESGIEAAIQSVGAAGFDTVEVQETFDTAVANRKLAHDLAAPVADRVIDLAATDWPDPARGQLESGRELLIEAQRAARAAATGYQRTVVELLRLLRG